MRFDEVIRGRRSIRGFLKQPVPKALIREILELAMRAPTSLNTLSNVATYDCAIHGSDIAPFDCGGVVNCIVHADALSGACSARRTSCAIAASTRATRASMRAWSLAACVQVAKKVQALPPAP